MAKASEAVFAMLMLLALDSASAFRVSAPVALRGRACLATMVEAGTTSIELKRDDPEKLAKILRRAWMEGGMKRGLTGAVVVPEDSTDVVTVFAQGPPERVASFGAWCEKELDADGKVALKELESAQVPSVEFNAKFDLAANECTVGPPSPLCQLLQNTFDDIAASSKLHSSDEGLA
jgi:acylphosphatase